MVFIHSLALPSFSALILFTLHRALPCFALVHLTLHLHLVLLTPKHLHCSQIKQCLHCIKGNEAMWCWLKCRVGKSKVLGCSAGSRSLLQPACSLAQPCTHFASLEPLPRPISLILPPLPPPLTPSHHPVPNFALPSTKPP